MEIKFMTISEMNSKELYDLFRLRLEVFIIEQNCIYQDIDDADKKCIHAMGYLEDELIACTRIIKPGIAHRAQSSIGRVCVKKEFRHKTYSQKIMTASIQKCFEIYPDFPINIHAQTYLENFYSKLGFLKTGKYFLEDNIPHLEMKYPIKGKNK